MTAIFGILALAIFVALMLVLPRLPFVRRIAGVEERTVRERPRTVFTVNCRDWLLRPTAVRGESSLPSSEERLRPVSIIRTESREAAEVLRRHSSGRIAIRVIGPQESIWRRRVAPIAASRWRRRTAGQEIAIGTQRLGNAIATVDQELASQLALAEGEAS